MHEEALTVSPATSATALYPGDTGTLPMDTRMVLCKLLTGPYIDADSRHWAVLLRDEAIVRSRMADLFLDLMLDRERRVAFTRQADTVELDSPVLMRTVKLTLIDSVLLLHLRESLVDAESRNEQAVVGGEELQDHLEIYALENGDKVGAMKRIARAIEKMRSYNILKSAGSPNRFVVSPTLRLLFTANDVEALGKIYKKIAAGEPLTEADYAEAGLNPDEDEADE